MAVPTSITQLSTTASSNSPAGTDSVGTTLDDYLRAIQGILKTTISQGSAITAASTITPGDGNYFEVTGNTGITAIGSTNSWNGREIVIKFSGTPTLTHSASLILPGSVDITCAAGDVVSFVQEASGTWRCTNVTAVSSAATQQYYASTISGTTTLTASIDSYAAYTAGDVIYGIMGSTNTGACTLNINSLGAKNVYKHGTSIPVQANDIPSGSVASFVYDGTQFNLTSVGVKSSNPNGTMDFRLSCESGTSVDFKTFGTSTTMYMVPYKGNSIALYVSGPGWVVFNTAQISAAFVGSQKCYDVFCYSNAGVPTLELVAWSNSTTRLTSLTTQDGVYVKDGDVTRRYIGSFYSNSSGQAVCDGSNQATWNYYNRVKCGLSVVDATATWNYSTATWRQARATSTNQCNFVTGLAYQTHVSARTIGNVSNSTSTNRACYTGVGVNTTLNVTNSFTNYPQRLGVGSCTNVQPAVTVSDGQFFADSVGRFSINWLEKGAGSDTQTWTGSSGDTVSGMCIEFEA